MKWVILVLVLILIALFVWYLCTKGPPNIENVSQKVIWQSDLSSGLIGEDWGVKDSGYWGIKENTFVENAIIKIKFPAGSASPSVARKYDRPLGGAQWLATLHMKPTDSLCLMYSLRFAPNFDFVKGGKLPGLFGGNVISGGNIPDGTNGFSTRFMWRTGGDGEVYAYLPTSRKYGTSFGRGKWKFEVGKWHTIKQGVKLNTPGKSNGHLYVWFDDKLVLKLRNVKYRTAGSLKIEGIFFCTFFGGGDTSWATPVDTHIDFKDFMVSNF